MVCVGVGVDVDRDVVYHWMTTQLQLLQDSNYPAHVDVGIPVTAHE